MELPKTSEGRDNHEDIDMPKSSQFLHKIVVNDEKELFFKDVVSVFSIKIGGNNLNYR